MHSVPSDLPAATAPLARARGADAYRRGSIPAYPMPGSECLALNKVNWSLDPSDSVLLVHDMQRYWVGFFAQPEPLLDRVGALCRAARAAGVPVVYTQGERPVHPAERALGVEMWGLGFANPALAEEEAHIHPQLAAQAGDFVIDKVRVNAFFDTPLAPLLQKMGRRQLLVCGVFAHHGVMMTCAEAFMRNYKVHLVADALGDYSPEDHWLALRYIAQTSGQLALHAPVLAALQAAA